MVKIYGFVLIVISCLLPIGIFAQQPPAIGVHGELNIFYGQIFNHPKALSGYGSRFYEIIPALGRFIDAKDITFKQPSFNIGIQGSMMIPVFVNDRIILSTYLGYSLGYNHQGYQILYSSSAPEEELEEEEDEPLKDQAGTAGKVDHIMFNAIINKFELGLHLTQKNGSLQVSLLLGALLYSPIHARWRRQTAFGDQTINIVGQDSVVINNMEAGKQIFSLRNTSEILATFGIRMGYGPIFIGLEYATNVRIQSLSVNFGLRLAPLHKGV